jgi:hypothetical protein
MKITRSSLLVTLLVLAAPACGNRLLVGDDPDGGGPPTGAAGTGVPTTGVAGTGVVNTGAGGSDGISTGAGGAAGSGTHPHPAVVTPLRISGEEAVRRLASVIWKELPDGDLAAQARMGHFTTAQSLQDPIRQLLGDPRARKGVGAFYRWWLDLDRLTKDVAKDPVLFPDFTPALASDMATETETYSVEITFSPNGTYQALMTSPVTYATERLAAIYGAAGSPGNATFRQLYLDEGQRAGLLTQPALQVLASPLPERSSPTMRGAEIWRKFLCKAVPLPPANVPKPETIPPGATTRQWLEKAVSQSASCNACHSLLDPLGLAFESFDAIGRWRTTDNGGSVDVSGLRINIFQPPPVISGAVELAKLLADRPEAHECMVRQWLTYALKRELTMADEATVTQVAATFRARGFNLQELILAVLTTDAFLAP